MIAAFVHYLERLVDFWRESGGFLEANQRIGRGAGVAPFLGHPDLPAGADPDLLHDAGACPRDRTGQGSGDILRAAAG
ncbi:MAG TPA: hypothetical protein VMI74_06745 [Burkholderiales bacterium]|nr:hypothetical protein [Burkholderiales bacterium]